MSQLCDKSCYDKIIRSRIVLKLNYLLDIHGVLSNGAILSHIYDTIVISDKKRE